MSVLKVETLSYCIFLAKKVEPQAINFRQLSDLNTLQIIHSIFNRYYGLRILVTRVLSQYNRELGNRPWDYSWSSNNWQNFILAFRKNN